MVKSRWTKKQILFLIIIALIAFVAGLIISNIIKNHYKNTKSLFGELAETPPFPPEIDEFYKNCMNNAIEERNSGASDCASKCAASCGGGSPDSEACSKCIGDCLAPIMEKYKNQVNYCREEALRRYKEYLKTHSGD